MLWPFYSSAQRNFATQGDQENYRATEIFKNNYSKQTFPRFSGQIIEINSYLIKYDSTVLRILTTNSLIKQIFTLGIFYPGIFNDPRIYDESSFTKPMRQINKSIVQT